MSFTILITGGAGFLGVNLVKYYLCNTHQVEKIIIVDNFITSYKRLLSSFLATHDSKNIVDVIEGDICNNDTLESIKIKYQQIQYIYHFASLASPPFYKQYPLHTLDVGYIGTRNVLELALSYKQRHDNCTVLFSSTSEVYGDALQHPQNESYYGNVNVYGKRSCYDESKRVAESLIYTYQRQYTLDARIVRIFNTYGPYMNLNDGRIVTEIIKSLLLGRPLTIYGNGNQTRSLSFVDDTIEQIVRVMYSSHDSPINVGNNSEITINQLVNEAKNVYQQNVNEAKNVYQQNVNEAKNVYQQNLNENIIMDIKYTSIDEDDPKIRKPCLKLNEKIVGNLQRTSLKDGLLKTLVYFVNVIEFAVEGSNEGKNE